MPLPTRPYQSALQNVSNPLEGSGDDREDPFIVYVRKRDGHPPVSPNWVHGTPPFRGWFQSPDTWMMV